LHRLEDVGVNHVVLNLKYGSRPAEVVLTDLERHVLEAFPPASDMAAQHAHRPTSSPDIAGSLTRV
jgi:hypothetical protein